MRFLVVILAVLAVTAGGTAAQPYGYLFPFSDESHSCWCVEGEGIYQFEMWLWCLPGEDGSIGAAFSMGFPSNVIVDTLIVNDAVGSDLIVSNCTNISAVSILFNNGDGTFQSYVTCDAGDGPINAAAVDLDGDYDIDLAVSNYVSNNISIFLNNGDGTFQSAVHYAAGSSPRVLCFADFDDDGDNDLAVANYYSDNISFFRNNGDGTFQTRINYPAGDVTVAV